MNYWNLDRFGRVRLSQNFYMREFLYSEIANFYQISNLPHDPPAIIAAGEKLAQELLEPLQQKYGRLHIRSGYRSPALNLEGNRRGLGCKSNDKNWGRKIWGYDREGYLGAMACVVIPSFQSEYERTGDMSPVANWINANLNPSELIFFKKQGAVNLGWREKFKKLNIGN
jgi:hypothetical protein